MTNKMQTHYENAQTIMQGYLTNRLVLNDAVFPHWITDSLESNDRYFWYIKQTKMGKEFRIVDAKLGSNTPLFDHSVLASALNNKTGLAVDPLNIAITDLDIALSPLTVCFKFMDKPWMFTPENGQCVVRDVEAQDSENAQDYLYSPNGKKALFLKQHNIWIKDLASGEEKALTDDGTNDNSYGASYMGADTSIQARWSPDSNKVFTLQYDSRNVSIFPLIDFLPSGGSQKPKINNLAISFAGDQYLPNNRLVVIDTCTAQHYPADYPAIPFVMIGPESFDGFFTGNLGWWSADSQYAFFVEMTRGAKIARVLKWDINTQNIQVLFEERSETFLKLCEDSASGQSFLPLTESNELIWYSERSGWPHLYLYDLNTGQLKHAITEGDWSVRGILHFDAKTRELLLQTAARDKEISPYYRDICKINIDSGVIAPIISGCFDHVVESPKKGFRSVLRSSFKIDSSDVYGVSPSGKYIVTTYSRVDTPPLTVLLDRDGHKTLTLETANTYNLPSGWQWPEPVKLKAADNHTDIYGVVFRPSQFSPDKHYPIIDFVSGARNANLVPVGSFSNSLFTNYYDMAALAELGFIVVGIIGRGTPYRDKQFHDHGFGKPGLEDDLIDHIAGIRQLSEQYSYMDINNVGITAMEAAANTIYAPLRHSDFYKVTVCHPFIDFRSNGSFFEMYSGITDKDKKSAYGGPEDYIESFKGKLFLITGPVNPAFLVIEALQKANRDFDMLCLPTLQTQVTSYTRRKGWDYLVTHLLGLEPPFEFKLTSDFEYLIEIGECNFEADTEKFWEDNSRSDVALVKPIESLA